VAHVDTDGAAEHVGVLASVIHSQAEIIKNQAQTIDVLSGSKGKAAALQMTIREAWDRYCRTIPEVRWKIVVICMMKRFLARFGDVQVGEFGPLHWEHFRDDPTIREHFNSTSRNLILRRAKVLFNWMINTDQISVNPLRKVKPEKKVPKRRTEVSHADEKIVLKNIDHRVMQAMFLVAIDSGMRRHEVRVLEWADVDMETRWVSIPAERTKTKTARSVRLTTRAIAALKKLPRYDGCPYVFANPHRKKPYSENFIWTRWRKVADENGLQPAPGDGSVRWHDLRRSTACRLVRLGAQLPAIQQILGHSDLGTTQLYLFAQPQDVSDAHDLLENATRKGPHRAGSREHARVSEHERGRRAGARLR